MNIFSELRAGAATFANAAAQIEQLGADVVAKLPAVETFVAAEVSALKQAASNMIPLTDSAAKAIVDEAEVAIQAAVDAAIAKYAPVATMLTPAVNDGLGNLASALKAYIDLATLKAKADLANAVAQ